MKRTRKWLRPVAAALFLAAAGIPIGYHLENRKQQHRKTGCGCTTCPSWEVCR